MSIIERVNKHAIGQRFSQATTTKGDQTVASEYQKTQIVDRSAEQVFSWASDVSNLPHYLPPFKEAWVEGPAEAGKPGEKVRMRVGIPDR